MWQLMPLLAGILAGAVTGTPVCGLCDHLASAEHGDSRVSLPRGGSITCPDSLGSHMRHFCSDHSPAQIQGRGM